MLRIVHIINCVVVVLVVCKLGLTAAETCGTLIESQLANPDFHAGINEYPWIANIVYGSHKGNLSKSNCQGVLVNKRNVLLPNHCLLPEIVEDIQSVRLGASTIDDEDGTAQYYDVDEIIVNPNFNRYVYNNDIALLRLAKDVDFHTYIQPICLPTIPSTSKAQYGDYVAKYFQIAGFSYGTEWTPLKYKLTLFILSRAYCKKLYSAILLDDERICGVQSEGVPLLPGAPVMAIHVENGRPKKFYLIGLLSGVIGKDIHEQHKGDLVVFQALSKSDFNWIQANLL